jgi:hypothetical protein
MGGVKAKFQVEVHILGSAYIEFDIKAQKSKSERVVFAGDLGTPILRYYLRLKNLLVPIIWLLKLFMVIVYMSRGAIVASIYRRQLSFVFLDGGTVESLRFLLAVLKSCCTS